MPLVTELPSGHVVSSISFRAESTSACSSASILLSLFSLTPNLTNNSRWLGIGSFSDQYVSNSRSTYPGGFPLAVPKYRSS